MRHLTRVSAVVLVFSLGCALPWNNDDEPTLELPTFLDPAPIETEPPPETDEPEPPPPTDDSGPPPGTKLVTAMDVEGEFGWNNEQREIVNPTFGGVSVGIGSFFEITLYGEGGQDADPADQCTILLDLEGFRAVPFVNDGTGARWQLLIEPGFTGPPTNPQFPNGVKPILTNCAEQGFSDLQYPDNPGGLVEYWGSLPFVISAIPGPLATSLFDQLEMGFGGDFVEEEFIQSRLDGPYGFDVAPFVDEVYLFGFEMDPDTNDVAVSGYQIVAPRILNPAVAAMASGELPSGFYRYRDLVVIQALPEELTYDPSTFEP